MAGEILKLIGLAARIFTTEAQRHGGIGTKTPHSRPLRVLEWATLEVISLKWMGYLGHPPIRPMGLDRPNLLPAAVMAGTPATDRELKAFGGPARISLRPGQTGIVGNGALDRRGIVTASAPNLWIRFTLSPAGPNITN